MQQTIMIDDGLLENAANCLAIEDANEIVNAALRELIKNHSTPVEKKRRRQPPASIAGKGKVLADLVEPCVDIEQLKKGNILDLAGILHRPDMPAVSIEAMDEAIQQAAVERYKQSCL